MFTTWIHSLGHFHRDILDAARNVVAIEEKQWLMQILQQLIDTTRRHRLNVSLAQEVVAFKAVFCQAREVGSLDFVIIIVSVLKPKIQV